MNIIKVKIKNDYDMFTGISITYEEYNQATGRYDTKTLESTEKPVPELLEAFKSLRAVAIYCGELPTNWESVLTVSGFSLTRTDDDLKVVMMAKRESTFGIPLNINTPIRFVHCDDDEKSMPTSYSTLLELAILEVEAYVKGKRSQMEIGLEA